MKSTTLNETALRLVALGYDVDTEQFDATGFDVATLNGKRQTAEDIIRRLLDERHEDKTALAESVKLQSHYAKLLNMHDGGERIGFENAEAWIARLRETKKLTPTKQLKATL